MGAARDRHAGVVGADLAVVAGVRGALAAGGRAGVAGGAHIAVVAAAGQQRMRSEEHTSELQSQSNLVCRLLLEKKKKNKKINKTQGRNKAPNTYYDFRSTNVRNHAGRGHKPQVTDALDPR